MLGLSWTEMLIIGVVALIFIGPKDLPVVMNRVGKVIGQIQRMGREFQREINKSTGLDEVRNLRTSITAPLKKSAEEIRREFNSIGKDGKVSPSGVIKPTDPKVESVAEEIRAKAGMPPAAKPIPPAPAPMAEPAVEPVATPSADPAPIVSTPAAKSAPVKAMRPRASAAADVVAAPAKPKPTPRARAKAAAPVIDAEGAPVPAPRKPRAPRKKPAAEAENN